MVTSNIKNDKIAITEGWVSVVLNTLLFALKYWAGMVSMSAALIADAWHTLSDSISSVVVIYGVKAARVPADEEHPFGHGRAELLTSLFIGFFLAFIGYEFMSEGISRFIHKKEAVFGTLAIVATIISIVFKEALAQYALWGYRKTKMLTLRADAWHHRSDALSSVVVLAGILMSRWFWWMDGALSCAVAMMILYAAYEVVKDGMLKLLGEVPEKETIAQLKKICSDVLCENNSLHHIHIHRYGNHVELTFHLRLPGDTTLDYAHLVVSRIEERVNNELGMEATIHCEPHK